ncbi:MAG: hypothetical protein ACRCYY_15940 [Trueperaceae bacterium]
MALGTARLGRVEPATRTGRPVSTLAFDWLYSILLLLMSAGVYMDGWSHIEFGPDQSVFSEYHLLFYTSLTLIGMWLLGNSYRYIRQGYKGFNAIPVGYTLSLLGVFVFGVGGVLDLTGHSLFGFETGMEALLSPTHMLLFVGWGLIALGPARAATQRQTKPNFLAFLPGLFSWTMFTNVLAFAGLAFFPTVDNPWMLGEWRTSTEWLGHNLGVMGIMAQSVLLVATSLWLIYNFRLPRGTFTFFFTLFALLTTITSFIPELIVPFVITGVLLDVLYVVLKPSLLRRAQLYSFGALLPVLFWTSFYGYVIATNLKGGVWYTNYIWVGSIVEAGIVGLLITLLSTASQVSVEKQKQLES